MYASSEPATALCPFVECYWSWCLAPDDPSLDDILPDAAPEFIVHFGSEPMARVDGGEWRAQYPAFLYCAANRPVRLRIREPMSVFAIRFRPWGVSRFTRSSMADMLDRAVTPRDALDQLGDDLVAALRAADSHAERVDVANSVLTGALSSASPHDSKLRRLLEVTDGGRSTSVEMAQRLSVSDRTFRRLWRDVVGIEPRKFIQLMRFHSALQMIDAGASLADVAAECGYSDQPHMARQIKSISGLPASALRRRLGNTVYRDLYASRPGAPWRLRTSR